MTTDPDERGPLSAKAIRVPTRTFARECGTELPCAFLLEIYRVDGERFDVGLRTLSEVVNLVRDASPAWLAVDCGEGEDRDELTFLISNGASIH